MFFNASPPFSVLILSILSPCLHAAPVAGVTWSCFLSPVNPLLASSWPLVLHPPTTDAERCRPRFDGVFSRTGLLAFPGFCGSFIPLRFPFLSWVGKSWSLRLIANIWRRSHLQCLEALSTPPANAKAKCSSCEENCASASLANDNAKAARGPQLTAMAQVEASSRLAHQLVIIMGSVTVPEILESRRQPPTEFCTARASMERRRECILSALSWEKFEVSAGVQGVSGDVNWREIHRSSFYRKK